MLEFGVVLANSGVVSGATTVRELVGLAKAADTAPEWDYVWVGDSLLAAPRFESVVLLSAIATVTGRVRLGVGCMASMGLRPKYELAVQWASLDVLSAGRLTLVGCPGPSKAPGIDRELAAFGMTHPEKVERMEQAIDLIRRAAADGGPDGEDAALVQPRFVQTPLPIWLAANPSRVATDDAVRRALTKVARIGDGWMTFGLPPAMLASRISLLHQLRAEQAELDGGAPASTAQERFPICVYVDVNIDRDADRAMNDAVLTCRTEGRRNATAEALAETAAIGSVDRCVEYIAPLIEAGVNHLAFRPVSQHPGRQIERLNESLLPALRALSSSQLAAS